MPIKLSSENIIPFIVRESRRLSPTVCLIRIAPKGNERIEPLPVCYTLSLYNEQCTEQRPYTPINLIQDYSKPLSHFEILVRHYAGGILSGFLCSRQPGDVVHLRGPFVKLDITEVVCKNKRLGLIAGGTGITPMLQIIRYVLSTCSDTIMTLLFGNVSDSEVLLREELDLHVKQSNGKLNVLYVVGPAITEEMIKSSMPPPDD